MLSTFSIILNEFSASLKHNSTKSTIGIFVNLLMAELGSVSEESR